MRLNEIRTREIMDPNVWIDKRCSQASLGMPIFRNTDKTYSAFISTIRQNRKPRNSSSFQVKTFDLLMSTMGWPHRKSNTLSCTGKIHTNPFYGGSFYRIYPFDGASYVCSPLFFDLYTVPDEMIGAYRKAKQLDHFDPLDQIEVTKFHKWVVTNARKIANKFQLQCYEQPNFVKNLGEVLVHGTRFIAVNQK